MTICQAEELAQTILPRARAFQDKGGTFAIRVRIHEVIQLCEAVEMLIRLCREATQALCDKEASL